MKGRKLLVIAATILNRIFAIENRFKTVNSISAVKESESGERK